MFGPAVVLAAGGASVLLLACYWLVHPRLRRMGPVSEATTLGPDAA
jgi:hypothetical protein